MKNLVITSLIFLCNICCACDAKKEKAGIEVINTVALNQELFAEQTKAEGVNFVSSGAWSSTMKRGTNSWISFTPEKGNEAGQYIISFSLTPNTTGNERVAVIAIHCGGDEHDITITQKSVDSNGNLYKPSSSTITVANSDALTQVLSAYQEEAESVVFVTTGSWSSTLTEADTWISFTPTWSSVSGQHTVSINTKMNFTRSDRIAVFTIRCGGEEINVSVTQKSSIFTDSSCSELLPGITLSDINAIPNKLIKDLASSIFEDRYESEFRAQEYRAWQHPDVQAVENKTIAYSIRDNPTGIYVRHNEVLDVIVGETYEKNISIISMELSGGAAGADFEQSYTLSQGINRIIARNSGLLYLQYYDPLGESAPKIKINFITGAVNGYFDSQKHKREDWQRILKAAIAPDFDVVGKFAHITYPVSVFRERTPDGLALIDKYDDLVRLEHELMGLYKEGHKQRQYKNRLYFHVDYTFGAAYATANRTGYSISWVRDELAYLPSINPWTLGHETGHINQIYPGMRWHGMIEVTNNLYALHVQTSWGLQSGLALKNPPGSEYSDVYDVAFRNFLNKGIPHNRTDVITKLIPFWQLKLYLHDVLGKTDFYPDLMYYFMSEPQPVSPATDGRYQLNFVRKSCEIAQLNLLDFFEAWGFLMPIDELVGDYSYEQFTITQTQIDALKAEIEAKGYPKPPKDFTKINDDNLDVFR